MRNGVLGFRVNGKLSGFVLDRGILKGKDMLIYSD